MSENNMRTHIVMKTSQYYIHGDNMHEYFQNFFFVFELCQLMLMCEYLSDEDKEGNDFCNSLEDIECRINF